MRCFCSLSSMEKNLVTMQMILSHDESCLITHCHKTIIADVIIGHRITSLRRRTGKLRFPCHDHGARITETSHVMFGAFLRPSFIYCLRKLTWNLNISTLKRTIIFHPPSYLGSSCYFSWVVSFENEFEQFHSRHSHSLTR